MNSQSPFRILAVCTGNVCRSPLVERVLQSGLDLISPDSFDVCSAGTSALVGEEMTPQTAGLVRVLGADDVDFESRQVTPDILARQNLILCLTRQHRERVLELAPALLRRTFTLMEFGRMVDCVSMDSSCHENSYNRWEQLIPLAAAARYKVMSAATEDDDVVDPYRREDAVYQQMMRQVSPAVQTLINYERNAVVT